MSSSKFLLDVLDVSLLTGEPRLADVMATGVAAAVVGVLGVATICVQLEGEGDSAAVLPLPVDGEC